MRTAGPGPLTASLRERSEAVPAVRHVAIADNMTLLGGTSYGTAALETDAGPPTTPDSLIGRT